MNIMKLLAAGTFVTQRKLHGKAPYYKVYRCLDNYYLVYQDEIIYTGKKEDTLRELYKETFDPRGGNTGRDFEDMYGPDKITYNFFIVGTTEGIILKTTNKFFVGDYVCFNYINNVKRYAIIKNIVDNGKYSKHVQLKFISKMKVKLLGKKFIDLDRV